MSQSDDAGSTAKDADSSGTAETYGVKGPGFPAQDDEVTCPSCGRFAGTYERCPYCGAGMRIRLSVRILRRLSVAVGILGVLLVWWAARNMEVPLRQVADFGPTENFAIVRLQGEIVSGPYYGDRGDSFYIGLDDGTGRVNVKAYGGTATSLRKRFEGEPLNQKDKVEVRGSIRIQAGKNPSLSLRVPADFSRMAKAAPRVPPKAVPLGSVTAEMGEAGQKIVVEARVIKAWKTGSGLGSTLDDGTGTLMTWMFSKDLAKAPQAEDVLSPGNKVRITGRLDVYTRKRTNKTTIQLRPFANASGIVLLEKGDPPPKRAPRRPAAPVASKPPAPAASAPAAPLPVAPGLDDVGEPVPGATPSPGSPQPPVTPAEPTPAEPTPAEPAPTTSSEPTPAASPAAPPEASPAPSTQGAEAPANATPEAASTAGN